MRIKTIRLEHLKIPLLIPFYSSKTRSNYTNSILVVIETTKGTIGYGETCPRPDKNGASISSVVKDLRTIQIQLFNRYFKDLADIRQLVVDELSIGNAAICGLELALLDAWSKETGNYLVGSMKGKIRGALAYSGMIPFEISPTSQYLLNAFSFKSIKIKLGRNLSKNQKRVKELQLQQGEDIIIRVDAQNAWTLSDALQQIPVLKKLGVRSFEGLFSKHTIHEYQQITEIFGHEVAIILDTAKLSEEEIKQSIKGKRGNGLSLNISNLGGIFRTQKVYELAQLAGFTCHLNAHVGETSLLTAAGIHLASIAPNLTYMEGAFGTLLLESDITQRALQMSREGILKLPLFGLDKGLGIDVEEALVAPYKNKLAYIEAPKTKNNPFFDWFKIWSMQTRLVTTK